MLTAFEPGLQWYADKLTRREPFSFVRYGDGEFDCILKLGRSEGGRAQKCLPDLVQALGESLTQKRSGEYYPAMNPGHMSRIRMLPKIEAWLVRNAPGLNWHLCPVFCRASIKGSLFPLVQALGQQRVVVVGPPWLKALPFADEFVPVRSSGCWVDADAVVEQLRDMKDVVISFSAGPTAKVLIHRLQPILGEHSSLIDFGSLWDVYCGRKTRGYHGRLTPETLRKNMTGK